MEKIFVKKVLVFRLLMLGLFLVLAPTQIFAMDGKVVKIRHPKFGQGTIEYRPVLVNEKLGCLYAARAVERYPEGCPGGVCFEVVFMTHLSPDAPEFAGRCRLFPDGNKGQKSRLDSKNWLFIQLKKNVEAFVAAEEKDAKKQ